MLGKIIVKKEKGKVTVITKDFSLLGEEVQFKIKGHVFSMFVFESDRDAPDKEFAITDAVVEEDDTIVVKIERIPHNYVVPLRMYGSIKIDGVTIMYEGRKPSFDIHDAYDSVKNRITSLLQR